MTKWSKDIMPDDALDPDSLVGRMLNPDAVQPEAMEVAIAFMEEYADDFKALAAIERAEREPLPLWRAMDFARFREDLDDDSDDATICAAEIEALRDWLLPEEPEPVDPNRSTTYFKHWERWDERQRLRAILTEQARIARGEQ